MRNLYLIVRRKYNLLVRFLAFIVQPTFHYYPERPGNVFTVLIAHTFISSILILFHSMKMRYIKLLPVVTSYFLSLVKKTLLPKCFKFFGIIILLLIQIEPWKTNFLSPVDGQIYLGYKFKFFFEK